MKIPGVEALTFVVGGTVFDWRGALETEVQRLSDGQGAKVDARQFATDWRVRMFVTLDRMKAGELPMLNADGIHRQVLDEVLDIHVSLSLSTVERDELNQVWHRMKTWSDAVDAIPQAARDVHDHCLDRVELCHCRGLLEVQRSHLGWHHVG